MSSLLSVGRGVPSALRLPLLRGRALIGGRWVEAASGETFPVVNPANGELIAHVSSHKPRRYYIASLRCVDLAFVCTFDAYICIACARACVCVRECVCVLLDNFTITM